jgi:hypothetical protein
MPTLRRILRHTPVVAMGLLLLMWIDSLFQLRHIAVVTPGRRGVLAVESARGWLQYHYSTCSKPLRSTSSWFRDQEARNWTIMGEFGVRRIPAPHYRNTFQIRVPCSLLLTALLPIAIGAFNGFRFSLRSWTAYVTLVSVEMAVILPNAEWKWFW